MRAQLQGKCSRPIFNSAKSTERRSLFFAKVKLQVFLTKPILSAFVSTFLLHGGALISSQNKRHRTSKAYISQFRLKQHMFKRPSP